MIENFEYVLGLDKKFKKQLSTTATTLLPDEIRVAPKLIGVCGSDLYHYTLSGKTELYLGHEWIGEVKEVGSQISHVAKGDFVTSSATFGCGQCSYCLKGAVNHCAKPTHLGTNEIGAIRHELVMKGFNALKLSSNDQSEVLIEVMAVAVEAIRLMKENLSENPENVLVMGAGTVGILIAYLLKEENIPVTIMDPIAERVERAKKLGLNALPLKVALMIHGSKEHFDVIFDATADRDGNKGGWHYLPVFAKKGYLAVMVGKYTRNVEIVPDLMSRLATRMVFMRGVPLTTLNQTISQWSGRLRPLAESIVSHTFSCENLDNAFATANNPQLSGKVVISME